MTNPSTYRALLWLPNTVTIIRVITAIALFAAIFYDGKINATRIGIFMAIALTDWVDGWLARKINAHTLWGQLLDPIADKVVLLSAFGYFYFAGSLSWWFAILYFVREVLQAGIRINYFVKNKNAQPPTLFISKLKTSLSYLYAILLFAEQINEVYRWPVVHTVFEIVIIFLSFTGIAKPFLQKWNSPAGKK